MSEVPLDFLLAIHGPDHLPQVDTLGGYKSVNLGAGKSEDRIGTGPPRARTAVIQVDLGYWAISGSIHPKGSPASREINSSVFRERARGTQIVQTNTLAIL